ncbi:MAG TPA: MazG family protein [Pseudonocardiaceae bacterium]|nr:MazG family protein [Pseudonocardiaceae bacterium]
MSSANPQSCVVLLDPRLGPVLPAAAVALLRAADAVYVTGGLPAELGTPAPAPSELRAAGPVVLITDDQTDPAALALLDAGARLIRTEPPAGTELLAAVAVMDRLRSPDGCPWDAEQTHETLRQYLIEETYELLEAIEEDDRVALREELGDVLLQVLFHARIAQEDAADPFTVDQVAEDLVRKLVGRHPHVFAGGDSAVRDAATQTVRWEELKQVEKKRESSVDGVALGAPALALAGKLISRTVKKGLPTDLWPTGSADEPGRAIFALAASAAARGIEPELELRAVARSFAQHVRAAEQAAKAAGLDPAELDATAWRKFWPARS